MNRRKWVASNVALKWTSIYIHVQIFRHIETSHEEKHGNLFQKYLFHYNFCININTLCQVEQHTRQRHNTNCDKCVIECDRKLIVHIEWHLGSNPVPSMCSAIYIITPGRSQYQKLSTTKLTSNPAASPTLQKQYTAIYFDLIFGMFYDHLSAHSPLTLG